MLNEFESYRAIYPKAFTDKYEKQQLYLKSSISNPNYGFYVNYRFKIEDKADLFWSWVLFRFVMDERRYRLFHHSYKVLYMNDDIRFYKGIIEHFMSVNSLKPSSQLARILERPTSNDTITKEEVNEINADWNKVIRLYGELSLIDDFLSMIIRYTDDDFVILKDYEMKFKSYLYSEFNFFNF